MIPSFDLTGKVALITGAGRGLGESLALGLAAAGANIVVVDLDLDAAQAVTDKIISKGVKAIAVRANVSDANEVKDMVEMAVNKLGTIDILVNNAGIQRRNACVDMCEDDWDDVINVNLKGAFLCCKEVGKVMLEKGGGKVINITSLLGTVAQPNRGPYAASKGGLVQLTKVLALEWAKNNITVNGIGPGYFLTELNATLMDDKAAFDELTSRIPMGRWGQADELIGALLFLASDAANYVTGQVIYIDGGYLCM